MGNSHSEQPFSTGHYGAQGIRPTMEDSVVMLESFGEPKFQNQAFFAVFDGHNGDRCSEFLAKELPEVLLGQKEFSNNPLFALVNAFLETDKIWLEKAKKGKEPIEDGSTAVCVLLRGTDLYVAHAGDSRAIVCQDARIYSLTEDHKPDNIEEKELIEKNGGYVQNGRVQGMLSVSRAFGDLDFKTKNLITCYPEVKYWPMTEETEFIVAACDGVWDVISNFKVGEYVRSSLMNGFEPEYVAKTLVNHCLGMGSTDNISIIIISFLNKAKIQKFSNSDLKVGMDEHEFSKLAPLKDNQTSKDKFKKIDQRNVHILHKNSGTPSNSSSALRRSLVGKTPVYAMAGNEKISGEETDKISGGEENEIKDNNGGDLSPINPLTSPRNAIVGDSRRLSVTDMPHLRVSKIAEDGRRERVKQQSMLHTKLDSKTKNYSTCKF